VTMLGIDSTSVVDGRYARLIPIEELAMCRALIDIRVAAGMRSVTS
jgi:hypothetical protein